MAEKFWLKQINAWIGERIDTDPEGKWNAEDRLCPVCGSQNRFSSLHPRCHSLKKIRLNHYWVEMVVALE